MDVPTPSDLRRLRDDVGLTQQELAEEAEVSQPLIARIENGDVDPRLSTVSRIVDALTTADQDEVRAGDLMSEDPVSAAPDEPVKRAVERMRDTQFSQLPVIEDGVAVGSTSDALIARARGNVEDLPEAPVRDVMAESFPTVSPDTDIDTVSRLLDNADGVLVTEEGTVAGIITDADLAAHVGAEA